MNLFPTHFNRTYRWTAITVVILLSMAVILLGISIKENVPNYCFVADHLIIRGIFIFGASNIPTGLGLTKNASIKCQLFPFLNLMHLHIWPNNCFHMTDYMIHKLLHWNINKSQSVKSYLDSCLSFSMLWVLFSKMFFLLIVKCTKMTKSFAEVWLNSPIPLSVLNPGII